MIAELTRVAMSLWAAGDPWLETLLPLQGYQEIGAGERSWK